MQQNLILIVLAIVSATCVWMADGFITFIVFNEEVQGVPFDKLMTIFTNIDLLTIMSFPEFWQTNSEHSFIEAPAFWFEPMTVCSGIGAFTIIMLFSRFVSHLKSEIISMLLVVIGILYMVVAWGVLMDVNDPKMVGSFLSIGIQGLLVHSLICCFFSISKLLKNVFNKNSNIITPIIIN